MSTNNKIIEKINSQIDKINAERKELIQARYLLECLDHPDENVPYKYLVHWHSNQHVQGEDVLIESFVNKFVHNKRGVTYEIVCERTNGDSWTFKLHKIKDEVTTVLASKHAFSYNDLNILHKEFIKLVCDDIDEPEPVEPKVIHINSIDDLKKYKNAIASPDVKTTVYANSTELVAACYALRRDNTSVTIVHTPSNTIISHINI